MRKRQKDNGDWGGHFTPAEHHAMRSRLAAAFGCHIGRGGVAIRNDTGEPLTFPEDADAGAPVRAALTAAGWVRRPDAEGPETGGTP